MLFEGLLAKLRTDVVRTLMHLQISVEQPPPAFEQPLPQMEAHHISPLTGEDDAMPGLAPAGRTSLADMRGYDGPVDPNNPTTWGKVQRNAPCPCGSGRKFKHCHGALV
jgi:preprotein translocase subunit SecA